VVPTEFIGALVSAPQVAVLTKFRTIFQRHKRSICPLARIAIHRQ